MHPRATAATLRTLGLLTVLAISACASGPETRPPGVGESGTGQSRTGHGEAGGADRQRQPARVMSYLGAPWLERAGRDAEEQPEHLLDAMELEDGDRVADLGCGTGYFSRRIARRVAPTGLVYAVDIQPQMLELLRTEVRKEGIENIETILSTETDPKLPEGGVDWVLLVDVYHELQQPEPVLAKIRESLAPGGRVALAEYRLEGDSAAHIKRDHRMSVDQVLAEWEPAGFRLEALHQFLPSQHLFIFSATP